MTEITLHYGNFVISDLPVLIGPSSITLTGQSGRFLLDGKFTNQKTTEVRATQQIQVSVIPSDEPFAYKVITPQRYRSLFYFDANTSVVTGDTELSRYALNLVYLDAEMLLANALTCRIRPSGGSIDDLSEELQQRLVSFTAGASPERKFFAKPLWHNTPTLGLYFPITKRNHVDQGTGDSWAIDLLVSKDFPNQPLQVSAKPGCARVQIPNAQLLTLVLGPTSVDSVTPAEPVLEATTESKPKERISSGMSGFTVEDQQPGPRLVDDLLVAAEDYEGVPRGEIFNAPLTKLRINAQELSGEFVNPSISARDQAGTTKTRLPIREQYARYRSTDSPSSNPSRFEYTLRPYSGTLKIATIAETATPELDLPLRAGEIRVLVDGEIQPHAIPDQTNEGIRLVGQSLIRRYRELSNGQAAGAYVVGVSSELRAKRSDSSQNTSEAATGLSAGDLLLKLKENEIGAVHFETRYATENGKGRWRFPVERVVKSPFRGGSRPTAPQATDPRMEVYHPEHGDIVKIFDSDGRLLETHISAENHVEIAKGADLMKGFIATDCEVSMLEPENTRLRFRLDQGVTSLTRPIVAEPDDDLAPKIKQMAQSTELFTSHPDAFYTEINVEFLFPSVPDDPANGSLPKSPTVIWREKPDAPIPNNAVRAMWHSIPRQQDPDEAKRYEAFINNNDRSLRMPSGWSIVLPKAKTKGQPVVALVEASSESQTRIDQTPLWFETKQGRVTSLWPKAIGLPPDKERDRQTFGVTSVTPQWSDLFPPKNAEGTHTAAQSPRDQNWRGFLCLGGQLGATTNLPGKIKLLLEELTVPYAHYDGNGCTMVCDHVIDLVAGADDDKTMVLDLESEAPRSATLREVRDNPNIQLVLGRVEIEIHQNTVQQFELQFWWKMPFFNRAIPDTQSPNGEFQWVEIRGRWEPGRDDASEHLMLQASLPDKHINVGWSGIEHVIIKGVHLTLNATGRWSVQFDGQIDFSDTGLLTEWFENRLPSLVFSGLRFDFDNPSDPSNQGWTFPTLQVNNQTVLRPKGYDFKLDNLYLERPASHSTARTLRLIGSLRTADTTDGFSVTESVKVDVLFCGSTTNPSYEITFDNEQLKQQPVRLGPYRFIHLHGALTWTGDTFEMNPVLAWRWTDRNAVREETNVIGSEVPVPFFYGSSNTLSDKKFWVAGAVGLPIDLEHLQVKKDALAAFFVSHHGTFDGLRDLVLAENIGAVGESLKGITKWTYTDEFAWFVGAYIHELDLKYAPGIIKLRKFALVLSDDGLFRVQLDLSPLGIKLGSIMLAVDWRKRRFTGNLELPELNFGQYQLKLGEVSFRIADGLFRFDWGYPFNENWGRSLKLKWEPPPWPVPINTVQGGVYFCYEDSKKALTVGAATRVGYEISLQAEAGGFGGYIAGGIYLGYLAETQLVGITQTFRQTGMVSFEVSARGGVIVFGLRWDIIRLWLQASTGISIALSPKHVEATFFARFRAGFKICLTPCTCISGSISYPYQFTATSDGTAHTWDPYEEPKEFLRSEVLESSFELAFLQYLNEFERRPQRIRQNTEMI